MTEDSTTSEKVGVIGFCMGGALALYTATKNPNIGACVVFYGGHPNVKPDLPNLQAPVLGLYGDKDKFVSPAVVHDLERQLNDLGKQFEARSTIPELPLTRGSRRLRFCASMCVEVVPDFVLRGLLSTDYTD
jgi:dienelactone hydrolase